MQHNPFESQLERLARTLTEQFGVKVLCQGDEAWTDGKQIVLPSLPEPMDSALERMIVGFLDHEMAHVAFSDFEMVKEFSEKHRGYEGMLNVVEDALIEQRAMQRWPGVRANLDAMFAQIRNRVAALAAQRDPFGRFCTAVYLKLAHYRDMLGLDSEVTSYEDVLDGFRAVHTTRDSGVLAEQLLDRWLTNNPPQNTGIANSDKNENGSDGDNSGDRGSSTDGSCTPDPNGSEHQTDGTDQPQSDGVAGDDTPNAKAARDDELPQGGNDGASGADQSQGEPSVPDTSQTKSISSEGSKNPPNSSSNTNNRSEARDSSYQTRAVASGDSEEKAPAEPNNQSAASHGAGGTSLVTQALAEAIAEHVAKLSANEEYRVYTKQFDCIDVVPIAREREVQALFKEHTDVIRRLRRGLANALRSREKRWWREEQSRGELSPRTLHRLCLDRPQLDVFRTRAMVQGRSTAVSIVLDASGSMTTDKMDVARDALRVLLEALDDLKVATEAITFTTGSGSGVFTLVQQRGEDPAELRNRYSRIANLEIGLVKQFVEPVKSALRRLPSIKGTGLTPLGEAMQVGALRLAPRRESRRIMLLLTDGRAGCESNDGAAVKHAQHVAKRIEQAGIELVGVGIMDESLHAIVEDTIVVHQLEELPAQLCKLLSRTLLRGMKYVG